MITPLTTAKELRVMLGSKAVTKDEAAAFLKARIDAKAAKGKFASKPTLNLYEELTGTHVMSKAETAKAEDVSEFDADDYRASCHKASLKQLKARLAKAHVQAKRDILEEVIASKESPEPSREEQILEVLKAALDSDDVEMKNSILQSLIDAVEQ